MNKTLILTALLGVLALTGCTQNQRAKSFGGQADLNLPPNEKLVTVTWEQDHLWYLTRPMRTNETAEVYVMKEQSSWGVWQGTYNIREFKQ